jgi:hypothetical protein
VSFAGTGRLITPSTGADGLQTEDVFREANERIAEKARQLELQTPIPFLCECSDERCFERIVLPLGDYEEARSDPQRYLTIAGHEVAGALVIAQSDRFALAEKVSP